MKLAIGCDHGGYALKELVKNYLVEQAYDVIDEGCYSSDRVDYPVYAHKVAKAVQNKEADYGICICKSGEGVCMSANKHKGIRAALVYNVETAGLCREHNDANVICFGASFTTFDQAIEYITKFLSTEFSGGRHVNRVALIEETGE